MSDVQSEIERMKVWENWHISTESLRKMNNDVWISFQTREGAFYRVGLPPNVDSENQYINQYLACSPRDLRFVNSLGDALQWCIAQYEADRAKPAAPKADAVEWRYLMLAGGMAAFMPDGYTLEIRCGMSLLNNTAIVHHTNGKHLVCNHETLEEAQQWCIDTYREMVAADAAKPKQTLPPPIKWVEVSSPDTSVWLKGSTPDECGHSFEITRGLDPACKYKAVVGLAKCAVSHEQFDTHKEAYEWCERKHAEYWTAKQLKDSEQ